MPSDIELMVGRVDLFDMPGIDAEVPWPNEIELLRNYLNKDHNWRHGLINVPQRALIADRLGANKVTRKRAVAIGTSIRCSATTAWCWPTLRTTRRRSNAGFRCWRSTAIFGRMPARVENSTDE